MGSLLSMSGVLLQSIPATNHSPFPFIPVVLEYGGVDRLVEWPGVGGVPLGEELLQDVPTLLHR